MRSRRLWAGGAAIILAIVAFAVLPDVYANQFLLFNLLMYMALAQGLNIIYGYTGYLPFGYVGFFGSGAYGFALAVMYLHWPPEACLLLGGVAAMLVGLILTPLLRLSGAYFAIANLAAAEALNYVVSNPNLTSITQGPYGISLPNVYAPNRAYWSMLVIMAAAAALSLWIRNSRFGLGLYAIRGDPVAARMSGVNVVALRSVAWAFSALIAGLAGGAFAWYASVFYPDTVFAVSITVFSIVFVLFGGVGTVLGPIIGTVVLYGVYNGIGVTEPQYFQLAYGILIVVLVLFLPDGILNPLKRWRIDVP